MADPADIAAQHDFTEEAIKAHQTQTKAVAPRGRCLYCEASIAHNLIYCDLDCRDAHEHEQKVSRNTRK